MEIITNMHKICKQFHLPDTKSISSVLFCLPNSVSNSNQNRYWETTKSTFSIFYSIWQGTQTLECVQCTVGTKYFTVNQTNDDWNAVLYKQNSSMTARCHRLCQPMNFWRFSIHTDAHTRTEDSQKTRTDDSHAHKNNVHSDAERPKHA